LDAITLDYTKTADDQTLIHTLKPLIQDSLWHDGQRWHIHTSDGTWQKATFNHCWPTLYRASKQLPDTPYWARTRHRLGMNSSARQIAHLLAGDAWLNPWPKPDGIG